MKPANPKKPRVPKAPRNNCPNCKSEKVVPILVMDGILVSEGPFYFLVPANVDKFLGVSYVRLREGDVNQKLVEYLQSIK